MLSAFHVNYQSVHQMRPLCAYQYCVFFVLKFVLINAKAINRRVFVLIFIIYAIPYTYVHSLTGPAENVLLGN